MKSFYGFSQERDGARLEEARSKFLENKNRGKDASFKLGYKPEDQGSRMSGISR